MTGRVYFNDGETAKLELSNGDFIRVERDVDTPRAQFLEDFMVGEVTEGWEHAAEADYEAAN